MTKKIFFTALIFLICAACLKAEETQGTNQIKKQKVFIYSFVPLDASGKYQYYSSIIPKTIAKSMGRNENLEIETTDQTFPVLPANATKSEQADYLGKIAAVSADYVVTGLCEIVENTQVMVNGSNEMVLKIRLQVFNLFDKSYDVIDLSSQEMGVVLKDTIDSAVTALESKIALFDAKNKKQMKPSPFLPAYRFFKRFTFGVDVGEVFILGKWADLYNWSEFVRPYFALNILDYLGIYASYDYFSTDNDDMNASSGSTMEIHTGYLGLYYTYRFARYFDVMVSAAGGVSFTNINFSGMGSGYGPFEDPLAEEKSIDASIDTGASFGFHFFSIVLRIGCSYRGYFYADEPLHGITVYGSLGYNF